MQISHSFGFVDVYVRLVYWEEDKVPLNSVLQFTYSRLSESLLCLEARNVSVRDDEQGFGFERRVREVVPDLHVHTMQ